MDKDDCRSMLRNGRDSKVFEGLGSGGSHLRRSDKGAREVSGGKEGPKRGDRRREKESEENNKDGGREDMGSRNTQARHLPAQLSADSRSRKMICSVRRNPRFILRERIDPHLSLVTTSQDLIWTLHPVPPFQSRHKKRLPGPPVSLRPSFNAVLGRRKPKRRKNVSALKSARLASSTTKTRLKRLGRRKSLSSNSADELSSILGSIIS